MNLATDISSGLVVIAGAVVAEAVTDPVTQYAGLIEKFGVMACLLLYFLVRDYLRTKADNIEKVSMAAKYDNLDSFIREKLMAQLNESTTAIRAIDGTHKKLLRALEQKTPCLADAAGKAAAVAASKIETQ